MKERAIAVVGERYQRWNIFKDFIVKMFWNRQTKVHSVWCTSLQEAIRMEHPAWLCPNESVLSDSLGCDVFIPVAVIGIYCSATDKVLMIKIN